MAQQLSEFINGWGQVVASMLAVLVWAYAITRFQNGRRLVAVCIFIVAAFFAWQSLSYIDLLPKDVARTSAFIFRVALVFGAPAVIWYWNRHGSSTVIRG